VSWALFGKDEMGLDTVELILQLEKEFDIDILDEDAVAIQTVGNLADYLETRTRGLDTQVSKELALGRLKEILEKEYGVEERKINATSRFVSDLGLD
jgi:acyl carrier protein